MDLFEGSDRPLKQQHFHVSTPFGDITWELSEEAIVEFQAALDKMRTPEEKFALKVSWEALCNFATQEFIIALTASLLSITEREKEGSIHPLALKLALRDFMKTVKGSDSAGIAAILTRRTITQARKS